MERGIELFLLNRGQSTRGVPAEAQVLHADVRDGDAVRAALGDRQFDAVVDWVAYTPEHVELDLQLFGDRTAQYVFISSASAYQTPPANLPVTESTPLANRYWRYSQDKIACEERLLRAYREADFPVTIVRPSHTYDERSLPMQGRYTMVDRAVAVHDNPLTTPFAAGAREILRWYDADATRQPVDGELNRTIDRILDAYDRCWP